MIKLIASDLDGTLIEEGSSYIKPETLETLQELSRRGILFAAASGRQYSSMLKVLAPIQDQIIFITDNGGYVRYKGKDMGYTAIDRETVIEAVQYIRSRENSFTLLTSPTAGYTDCKDAALVSELGEKYKVYMEQVDDVLKVQEPILKVAMYCHGHAQEWESAAARRFEGRLNVSSSGTGWIDFVDLQVDKGKALERIQSMLGITREETMAFGDNSNDIGMLRSAGESYAMGNARESVKLAAKHIADTNLNDGVLKVLKTLL